MINKAANQVLERLALYLKSQGWNGACNAIGVQLENGKVVANPAQAGRELKYIGIEDNQGTYVYFRENSTGTSLGRELLGACENGITVSREIRAIAVSNNLQNTAQALADKLISDIVSAPFSSTPLAKDIVIVPRTLSDIQAEIYSAETGTNFDTFRANRVVLAAFDFALEFSVNPCNFTTIKLC